MTRSIQDAQHCLRPDTGHSGGLLFVILLGLALSIAAGLLSSRVMRQGAPVATAASAGAAAPGTSMDVVVQVSSVTGGTLEARLLERRGQGYALTARTLQVALTPDTRYVMGARADLKPGAILQLKGIAQDAGAHSLQASQAVILTGYVQVAP